MGMSSDRGGCVRLRGRRVPSFLGIPCGGLVEWELLDESVLDAKAYTTTLAYDGLSRVRAALYPEDVASHRAEVLPKYNRAGALQSLWQDGVNPAQGVQHSPPQRRTSAGSPEGDPAACRP